MPCRSKVEKGFEQAKRGLKAARDAALCVDKKEGCRLALCFAIPSLPESEGDSIDKQLHKWLGCLMRRSDFSSVAWVFPTSVRRVAFEGYLYPSAVLLVRRVWGILRNDYS